MEDVKSVVQWAMEIADDLPEKYQQVAFAELLRHALEPTSVSAEVETGMPETESPRRSGELWQERLVSGLPDDYLIVKKGTREQQTVWAAIKLCEQGDEATSKTVRETIKTRLGVTPESQENTSRRLRQLTPEYLGREKGKEGQGYAYTPTDKALKVFKGLKERLEE